MTNALNHSIQVATIANGPWQNHDLSTTSRAMIESLTRGQACWTRSGANGSAGASEWSVPNPAMAI